MPRLLCCSHLYRNSTKGGVLNGGRGVVSCDSTFIWKTWDFESLVEVLVELGSLNKMNYFWSWFKNLKFCIFAILTFDSKKDKLWELGWGTVHVKVRSFYKINQWNCSSLHAWYWYKNWGQSLTNLTLTQLSKSTTSLPPPSPPQLPLLVGL